MLVPRRVRNVAEHRSVAREVGRDERPHRFEHGAYHRLQVIVARGGSHGPVKVEVGVDGGGGRRALEAHALDRVADAFELARGHGCGGQRGGLSFQRGAHLEHIADGVVPFQQLRVDLAQRLRRLRRHGHEGAYPLARLDQALAAQAGDGFAHDVAADAEILGQELLRRQAVAVPQTPRSDLLAQRGDQVLGQMGPALHAPDVHFIHMYGSFSLSSYSTSG